MASPVLKVQCGRGVSVQVWENTGQNGKYYNVDVQRAFKRGDDAEWEYTNSLRSDDCLRVQWGLGKAYDWIMRQEAANRRQQQQEREQQRPSNPPQQDMQYGDDDIPF